MNDNRHSPFFPMIWGRRKRPRIGVRVALILLAVTGLSFAFWTERRSFFVFGDDLYNRPLIASTIGLAVASGQFPSDVELAPEGKPVLTRVRYTIDQDLQSEMEQLLQEYKPDYGAVVAIDAKSGRILSLVSHTQKSTDMGNLALRAIFPTASVFKVVTAAAAIDRKLASVETVIPFNGGSNTLYRRNVNSNETNRWTRYMTLKEAFGRSVNTVFGKLGVFYVGPQVLGEYAERFGFNHPLDTDMPLDTSRVSFDPHDSWSVAEAASGFTKDTTMSPLHAAMIAAAVANSGVMMEPYIVEKLTAKESGKVLFRSTPEVARVVFSPLVADDMRALMRQTVKTGTSSKVFRSFLRSKEFSEIEVGGKTGSLNSLDPKGRCDWFVAYADINGRPIAIAALTVHEQYWRVKSAYLVRRLIENLAKRGVSPDPQLHATVVSGAHSL